ncbi:hypothetical protein POTOM_051000 [Populus tomentosa]|uniref:Uncharacterized protein n=1 Tax=Populus tomentosa TaxID=118781 RepID=A0A8X7YAB4_POPTO|nr:hypothetical protein POTOM_051000 [Populus tomentosa]
MDPNMSNNTNKSNKTGHIWTNEEHLHFLQSMEASFVRTMLENNGPLLRLDRYLPDSSESTLDLKSQRKKKHGTPGRRKMSNSLAEGGKCGLTNGPKQGKCIEYALEDFCWDDVVGPSRTRMEGRVDKRSTRRFSSHHKHYDPSQDQVVPQADIRTNDKDERDLPNVAVAPPSMAPAS